MQTVKWFQVLPYNSHNITSVICLHTVCFIWPIDRMLSGVTTPGQSGPGSNGNGEVFHISKISKAWASLSYCLMSYPGIHWRMSYDLCIYIYILFCACACVCKCMISLYIDIERIKDLFLCVFLFVYRFVSIVHTHTHKQCIYIYIYIYILSPTDRFYPVGWGCRIHWLLLCRGVKPLQWVSWLIWH